jgi:putative endonuclease
MTLQNGDSRKQLGTLGEQLAAELVTQKNMSILARNWRCRTGEIDIIADDDGVIVFIEVRTRRMTGRFGTPQESVDYRKQRQVRHTAQVYLHQHQLHDRTARFDLVAVEMDKQGILQELVHLQEAF